MDLGEPGLLRYSGDGNSELFKLSEKFLTWNASKSSCVIYNEIGHHELHPDV
jgi:hypothetical protein